MNIDVFEIAKIAHEVNRAYCQALGDTSQISWDEAPEWQKRSALLGIEFCLKNKDAGPDACHKSWMKQKLDEGWIYGIPKNTENKVHPYLIPFEELSKVQQAKDFIFKAVVEQVSNLMEAEEVLTA